MEPIVAGTNTANATGMQPFLGATGVPGQREWWLKRNCALTPRQLGLAYMLLFVLSMSVSGSFALMHGAWQVLVFAVLELAAVAFAFLYYARHATDQEHIALSEQGLLIERESAGQWERMQLDPVWARIAEPRALGELVSVEARGMRVEVGSHVPLEARQRLARELRAALRRFRV